MYIFPLTREACEDAIWSQLEACWDGFSLVDSSLCIEGFEWSLTCRSGYTSARGCGSQPSIFNLQDIYWHVHIPRYCCFLAFQAAATTFLLKVLPFGQGITLRVFSKLAKEAAKVDTLFHLDNRLLNSPSVDEARRHVYLPSHTIKWLDMSWDTQIMFIFLSRDNYQRIMVKLCRAIIFSTFTRHQS